MTDTDSVSSWLFKNTVKPFAVSTSFVLVALLWTFLLQHVIAYPFVFLFFGAIMGSAWFGGLVSGFLSVVISSILIAYFFVPPLFSMSVAKESQSFFTAFILCAIAITIVSSARKRSETAIRRARDELETRVKERTAELTRSNAEILERERQLRELTEAIPQQIWRANADGVMEYCNHHLLDYIGKGIESLKGEGFFGVLHPEDELLFREAWQAARVTHSKFEIASRVRGMDGIYRWFLVRSIPQIAPGGAVSCWYGVHIDIEEQRTVQQQLVVAQDTLTNLLRTQSLAEMAASIAHELNQPLTAVVTHAYACREWLCSKPANLEKASATAEKIVQESTRASSVVARVRSLFRKEAQTRESEDVNRLIQELVRLLRDEAIRRNVSIRMVLTHDLPHVEMDPVQIQQVLLNLATNGMDAMTEAQPPRELTIRSRQLAEDELLISVEDRGLGVPAEIAGKIFEPFFTTKRQGTGMGLAICRSIIEAHDGRLWTENCAQGGGCAFHFTLRASR